MAGNAEAAAAVSIVGDIEIATRHLLLYALLPLLNAGTDMLSLWITCAFLKRTSANRPQPWLVLVRIFVDLCLAALCFAGLIVVLWAIFTFWGWISPTTVPLDLRAYWTGVQADPRTGVALYLMALTTLIPTLIHITVGLGAILTQRSVSLLRMAIELIKQPSTFLSQPNTLPSKRELWIGPRTGAIFVPRLLLVRFAPRCSLVLMRC